MSFTIKKIDEFPIEVDFRFDTRHQLAAFIEIYGNPTGMADMLNRDETPTVLCVVGMSVDEIEAAITSTVDTNVLENLINISNVDYQMILICGLDGTASSKEYDWSPITLSVTFQTRQQLGVFVELYGAGWTVARTLSNMQLKTNLARYMTTAKEMAIAIGETIDYDDWVKLGEIVNSQR